MTRFSAQAAMRWRSFGIGDYHKTLPSEAGETGTRSLTTDYRERRSRNQTQTPIHFTAGNEGNKGRGDERLFVLLVVFGSISMA